jgi:hypothetical protein
VRSFFSAACAKSDADRCSRFASALANAIHNADIPTNAIPAPNNSAANGVCHHATIA